MATTLNKVITRNVDNTITTSTNYSELNVKASNLANDLVTHLQAQVTAMEGALQTKEGAVDVKIASLASVGTSTYTTPYLDRSLTMLSKAEFNAVAAERRANRAGSGFDEFGRYADGTVPINEGMWVSASYSNFFRIGRSGSSTGPSKTSYPMANINGVSLIIKRLQNAYDSDENNSILIPPAPTVLPSTATLTQQQIDSGVIKHADASNSGLILNGKYDTDTSGWTTGNGSIITVESGKLKLESTGTAYPLAYQNISGLVIGKEYQVECNLNRGTTSLFVTIEIQGSSNYFTTQSATSIYGVFKFTATATTHKVQVSISGSAPTTTTAYFDNISVFPADAISRSDLVFLESWHEDISEKDFVYPLGNVQYLGTTGDAGTPVAGAFAGAVTYSLFSDTWQADSALIGKGYVWSTLSDANKKAFIANPENNCYLDGDKVIQVRYRMRVVMGWGDSWYNAFFYNTIATSTNQYLSYSGINTSSTFIKTKGIRVISDDMSTYANGFRTNNSSEVFENGLVMSDSTSILGSYDGRVRALPIALVHRRNQGMNHPVYNPNGTKLASDGNKWYNTAVSFTSIADTMTDTKLTTASGYIGTTSARADGIFYDQVHEGDITDLRMSSQKVEDYNRLIDREFNKLVAGTYRGSDGEWRVIDYLFAQPSSNATAYAVFVGDATKYKIGDTVLIESTDNSIRFYTTLISVTTSPNAIGWSSSERLINRVIGHTYSVSVQSNRTKSNTLTHTDIIGSPTNYPTAWKQSGVSGVPLIVAEDGTSLLPTGTTGSDGLAVFKLSRKANATPLQVLKSTDSGATWTALTVTTHYTFSTTTNAITFTAGNIPLVADLVKVTYQTHTSMATPTVNSEVLAIGDGMFNHQNDNANGQLLISSLIGKVGIAGGLQSVYSGIKLTNFYIGYDKKLSSQWSATNSSFAPTNAVYPAVKVFPYLTRSNGKAWLNLVFKEMKYGSYAAPTVVTAAVNAYILSMTYKINIAGCALDGMVVQWITANYTAAVDWSLVGVRTDNSLYILADGTTYTGARLYDGDSWGDDSKFNIVDNVSTTLDTNGATVLIGQKRVELPYFISAGE